MITIHLCVWCHKPGFHEVTPVMLTSHNGTISSDYKTDYTNILQTQSTTATL